MQRIHQNFCLMVRFPYSLLQSCLTLHFPYNILGYSLVVELICKYFRTLTLALNFSAQSPQALASSLQQCLLLDKIERSVAFAAYNLSKKAKTALKAHVWDVYDARAEYERQVRPCCLFLLYLNKAQLKRGNITFFLRETQEGERCCTSLMGDFVTCLCCFVFSSSQSLLSSVFFQLYFFSICLLFSNNLIISSSHQGHLQSQLQLEGGEDERGLLAVRYVCVRVHVWFLYK